MYSDIDGVGITENRRRGQKEKGEKEQESEKKNGVLMRGNRRLPTSTKCALADNRGPFPTSRRLGLELVVGKKSGTIHAPTLTGGEKKKGGDQTEKRKGAPTFGVSVLGCASRKRHRTSAVCLHKWCDDDRQTHARQHKRVMSQDTTGKLLELPVELRFEVLTHCHPTAMAALATSCSTLSQEAAEEAARRLKRARENVDRFAQRWQMFTSEWDQIPLICKLCRTNSRRSATLFYDTGRYISHQYNDTCWICDECREIMGTGFDSSPGMKRVDLAQPHAWAGSMLNDLCNGILSCAPIADVSFDVPASLKHAIDPDALASVQDWFSQHGPWAAFVGINIGSAPSLRAWIPLQGSLTVDSGTYAMNAVTLIPMVCCDKDSGAWGNVIVVEFFHYGCMSRWTRLSDSIDALATESEDDARKRFWVARIAGADTAGIETPKSVPFNQTNLAAMIMGVDMFAGITGGAAHDDGGDHTGGVV